MEEKISGISWEIKSAPVEIGLIITGASVKENIIITKEKLLEIASGNSLEHALSGPRNYSAYDNHGDKTSKSLRSGKGIDLNNIVYKAGAENAEEIKFKSVDNFETTITEYSSENHYIYPKILEGSTEGAEEVAAMLAFYSDEKEVKYFPHPNLLIGQKGLEDKNKDFFAKGIKAITVGNKRNIFSVYGTAVERRRNYTLLNLLELIDSNLLKAQEGVLTYNKSNSQENRQEKVLGISLPILLEHIGIRFQDFHKENIEVSFVYGSNNKHSAVTLKDLLEPKNKFFLCLDEKGNPKLKIICNPDFRDDNKFIFEDVKGILLGEEPRPMAVKNAGKKPNIYNEDSEFFIYVENTKNEGNFYYYSLKELISKHMTKLQEFVFYNHNMNNGKGADRKVLARGFYLKDIFEDISEIGGEYNLSNSDITMQICAIDGYRAEVQLDVTEIYEYNYFLAYEIDQRTESGLEPNDTSRWEDDTHRFMPAEDETRFCIYCNKGSANPSVFTKVSGIVISMEGKKILLGEQGENCSYKVLYENNEGKEVRESKIVKGCVPRMNVTEKMPEINNCILKDEENKTITLSPGGNNQIVFKYDEKEYFFIQYTQINNTVKEFFKLTKMKNSSITEFETEPYMENIWSWKSIFFTVKLSNLIDSKVMNKGCGSFQLIKNDGSLIDIANGDEYYIAFKEVKKKAKGKLAYHINYKLPCIIKNDIKSPKEVYREVVGIVVNMG